MINYFELMKYIVQLQINNEKDLLDEMYEQLDLSKEVLWTEQNEKDYWEESQAMEDYHERKT